MKLSKTPPTLFLGLILLIGLPFFFYGGPGYHSSRSFQAAWDLGHILYFALATLWALSLMRNRLEHWLLFPLFGSFFCGILVFGLLIEYLQTFSGNRSPDMLDVLRNQLGCMLAFAFCVQPNQSGNCHRLFRWFRLTALLFLLLAFWPLALAVVDEQLARHQFPILSDFETPFEKYRWVNEHQLREETAIVRHGKKAMRVKLSTAKYSGTALFYFPGNWQGYQSLHCSVYNTLSTTVPLTLRMNDVEHKQHGSEFADRYNKTFSLQPGWNDLVIDLDQVRNAPKGRKMDMAHIEGFGLFVVQQAKPMEIIIDHIFLAP